MARRKTGFVARKIRAHTARKNSGSELWWEVVDGDHGELLVAKARGAEFHVIYGRHGWALLGWDMSDKQLAAAKFVKVHGKKNCWHGELRGSKSIAAAKKAAKRISAA